jgi:predicted ArsR family transcriptional regulator
MPPHERCYRSNMSEPIASAAPSTRPSTAPTGPARARARLAAAASAIAGAVTDANTPATTSSRGDLPGSSLRRQILLALRRVGPASPDELSRDIGASRSGIVGQLRALEAAKLVTHRVVRHGVGRPRHVYDVTPDAQDLFPANYDGLAAGLVGAILDVGGEELLDAVFDARRRQLGIQLRGRIDDLGTGGSLEDRARVLAAHQDELGYLAEVVRGDDGALRVIERNCAIHRVAGPDSPACDAELALFSEVLGTTVVRETHIPSGDRCCTYRVDPAPA